MIKTLAADGFGTVTGRNMRKAVIGTAGRRFLILTVHRLENLMGIHGIFLWLNCPFMGDRCI